MHERKLTREQRRRRRLWRKAKPFLVAVISVFLTLVAVRTAVNYVLTHYLEPVDKEDSTPIEVVIPKSSSASRIARILYTARGEDEKGLIQNTAVFKVYVDFVGKAGKMQAGTYILSRNMSMKQIVDIICEGNPPKPTVVFTVPEGYTVPDIAHVLKEKGLITAESQFISACADRNAFSTFGFLKTAFERPNAKYPLEGYLFPDTYEVFEDASAESVIMRMLNRFNEVFSDKYRERAEELGMTMDEVITLASLIEREAQVKTDFPKVSAVFHNRLKEGIKLQSCASLGYALGVNKLSFSDREMETESAYNTYLVDGLPCGPICNPGRTAIEAALWPNEVFLNEGYLYFCNGNPAESKELVFAKSYKEHQNNVKKYRKYWS